MAYPLQRSEVGLVRRENCLCHMERAPYMVSDGVVKFLCNDSVSVYLCDVLGFCEHVLCVEFVHACVHDLLTTSDMQKFTSSNVSSIRTL